MNKSFLYLMMILSGIITGISIHAAEMNPCGEVYFEGAYLNRVDTQTGFFYAKGGYCLESLQFGLVSRLGADTRTASDSSNSIFNDNYFFIGAGISLRDVLPGVRLLAEGGYSFDMSAKIHRKGADYRAGWMSYHEFSLFISDLNLDLYSEGIYVHRYLNFLFSIQPKIFYSLIKPGEGFKIGPFFGLNLSHDSESYDYNRFIEMSYGLKAKWMPFGAQVYGVRGFRTSANSSLPAYSDFRILLFGYFSTD